MPAQFESARPALQEQLAVLEDAWLAVLLLPSPQAEDSRASWGPLAQQLIDRGHGQVLLVVLEKVLRQSTIRSQRQTLLDLCSRALDWSTAHPRLQRQWFLLREWMA
jgi:hypothetical protein